MDDQEASGSGDPNATDDEGRREEQPESGNEPMAGQALATATGDSQPKEKEVSTAPEDVLREEILAAVGDLFLSQRETLRLAAQWSRYEAVIDEAAKLVSDGLRESDGSRTDAVAGVIAQLNKNTKLSGDQRTQAIRRGLDAVISDENQQSDLQLTAYRNPRLKRRDLGLLSSQLVTLVADFELFVLRVMTAWIEFDPTLLADRKRELSFQDLGMIESLEDVRRSMVQSYLEDHMHKSATSWFKVFCDAFAVKQIEGMDDFVTREVFQRRHIIVHHGGVVSREYISQLKDYEHSATVGDHLPVDLEYIRSASDALGVVAHSVALAALFSSSAKSPSARTKAEKEVGELLFLLLSQDRDALVQRFATVFRIDQLKDEFAREQTRVNAWIARRRLGELSGNRREIEEWDTSAKDSIFKLARAVLLRNVDESAVLARRLISANELNELAISRWPLFEEIREELLVALATPTPTS